MIHGKELAHRGEFSGGGRVVKFSIKKRCFEPRSSIVSATRLTDRTHWCSRFGKGGDKNLQDYARFYYVLVARYRGRNSNTLYPGKNV